MGHAAKAIVEADQLQVKMAGNGLTNSADGGIDAGAIAAGGQDADFAGGFRFHGKPFRFQLPLP